MSSSDLDELFYEPQFKPLSDDGEVICPYCQFKYQPEAEDYSEDTREQECSECGKKYHLSQTFSVDHNTKPDCDLNGEQHKFQAVKRYPQYQRCTVCDKWRSTPVSAPGEGSAHD